MTKKMLIFKNIFEISIKNKLRIYLNYAFDKN